MSSAELVVDRSEPAVLQLFLNRPHQLNAWTVSLEAALFAALDGARDDEDVRVVVISGRGRGFCAGASRDMLGGAARPNVPRRQLVELSTFPKPIIAAINGPAIGIGLALALACDIRFCSDDATLSTAFAKLGLIAEHATAWLLPRIVGRSVATDLLLSGRSVDGAEAARLGLVNFTAPQERVVAEAVAYARSLAQTCAPQSWAVMKQQLLESDVQDWAAASKRSAELMEPALASAEHREAVAAWRDKRAPIFASLNLRRPAR